MIQPISITELNTQIKSLLEATFVQVCVQAEISNLTIHKSGHIYFSLKDENSVISAVLFKGNAAHLKFRLEEGLKVIVYGSITVYAPRGNYQIICQKIEPSGIGALWLAYEQLKTRLKAEGLFDASAKKPLPKFPKKIAIVTSDTGAAIEDMKKVAQKRWPLAKLVLIPTLVQGEMAKNDIVKSIKFADLLNADLMIVGRGGGSLEDLWAFNEEIVARAIFEAKTPIISAVGHESDVAITDFAADVRAATPSNAMEIALPDMNDMRFYLDNLIQNFDATFLNFLSKSSRELEFLKKSFEQNSITSKLNFNQATLDNFKQNFDQTMKTILNLKQNELRFIKDNFALNEPSKKIQIGFAQILKDSKIVKPSQLKIDDVVSIVFSDISFESKIISKHKI